MGSGETWLTMWAVFLEQLGLSPTDFADSFDDDMGDVDAFRLWGMAAFDDEPQIRRYLETAPVPPDWAAWVAERLSPGGSGTFTPPKARAPARRSSQRRGDSATPQHT
jgi:hypothetical protein